MINNCGVIQAYGIRNQMMAKEIADVIGGITQTELLKIRQDHAVMATPGKPGKLIKKLDYLSDPMFQHFAYSQNRLYKNK